MRRAHRLFHIRLRRRGLSSRNEMVSAPSLARSAHSVFLIQLELAGAIVVREELRVSAPVDDGFELAPGLLARERMFEIVGYAVGLERVRGARLELPHD